MVPEIIFDSAGETYTIIKTRQFPGTVFRFEMLPEFNNDPDSFVHYHSGKLYRFCPDGTPCGDQGKDLPIDPFTKIGLYTFIVYEESEWDCISPKGAFPHRVQLETLEESGAVGGDIYISAGTWEVGQVEYTGPVLIQGLEDTQATLVSSEGVLFHHITTTPL